MKINQYLILSFILASLILPNISLAKDLSETKNIDKLQNSNSNKSSDKKFSLGIFGSYQKSEFSFDTPAAHSILKWREMRGYSIGTELKYKTFSDQNDNLIKGNDIFFSYEYSNLKGEGTDDDISNYDKDYGFSYYSIQKAKGYGHDFRLGTSFDFEKFSNITPSLRIGGFNKMIKFDMNDGVGAGFSINSPSSASLYYDKISGLAQRTRSQFSGLFIGGKLSHKNGDSENALIFDFYPAVKYFGKQFWPQREPESQNWELEGAKPGYGFKVALEHYFKVNNQTLKLFSSFESIKINELIESAYYYTINGGDANSTVKGNAKYNSFNMGLGFYF